jgi:hypothetical protein
MSDELKLDESATEVRRRSYCRTISGSEGVVVILIGVYRSGADIRAQVRRVRQAIFRRGGFSGGCLSGGCPFVVLVLLVVCLFSWFTLRS